MNPNPPSLYERLGGEDMIASLIPAFYVRVLADPELGPFFKDTSIEKLHAMQREFFVMATGGPIQYSGRPLAHAHHGRGITKHHYALFTGHLVETLLDMGVTQEETDEVIDRINTSINEITGVSY
ncbi:group 1 truncated hemoglobin [Prosthecobacter sp.]|uniref:group I truncated hemoglobin n=1 Tax=Prosthecobacter sp. TaxID=1965333 RepID=UPI001D75D6BC|nr:group 1 truncated hemoglobin [Prosthecobacter sp.]MCB1279143.1 group 1 truncated hemoglobin [Prosthecobacter sp.]